MAWTLAIAGLAHAQLTLQLPLERFTHGFRLAYYDSTADAWLETSLDIAAMNPPGTLAADGSYLLDADAHLEITLPVVPAVYPWLKLIDDTAGDFIFLTGSDVRGQAWDSDGSLPKPYSFVLPESRYGNSLVVTLTDGSAFPVTSGALASGTVVGDLRSYGFFNATAAFDYNAPDFRLVDLATVEQGPANTTNLLNATWEPLSIPGVVRTATVILSYEFQNDRYTFHTSGLTLAGETSTSVEQDNSRSITGIVGVGEEFWVTRDSDGKSSPRYRMLVQDLEVDATAVFGGPPPPNIQPVTFQISQDRAAHVLAVHHPDGLVNSLGLAPGSSAAAHQLIDANGQEVWYGEYRADVDVNQAWWLVDETANNENLGQSTTVLTGWQPVVPPPPPGTIGMAIANSHRGHRLMLVRADGITHPVTENDDPSVWHTQWKTFTLPDGSQTTLEIQYFSAGAGYDPAQAFAIVDENTGERADFPVGTVGSLDGILDLTEWFPESPLSLKIPVSRWQHSLWLVQPDGRRRPITRGSAQGSWAPDAQGQAWFTSYWYFDAQASHYAEWDFWIEDATTGETAPLNTTDLSEWNLTSTDDEDYDGLPDWYEFLIGTNPSAADSDGDGLSDYFEASHAMNPLSIDSDHDGLPDDWEMARFGNLARSGSELLLGGLETLQQRFLAESDPDTYDTDHDGIPNAIETDWGLDFNDPLDAYRDMESDGLVNLSEYRGNTDPYDYYNGTRRHGLPMSPNFVTPEIGSDGSIAVIWTDRSDNETGFKVYGRSSVGAGNWILLGTTGINENVFRAPAPASPVSEVLVTSINPEGESEGGSQAQASGAAGAQLDSPVITATRLIEAGRNDRVQITCSNFVPHGVGQLLIFRSSPGEPWSKINQGSEGKSIFIDENAPPNKVYTYKAIIDNRVYKNRLRYSAPSTPAEVAEHQMKMTVEGWTWDDFPPSRGPEFNLSGFEHPFTGVAPFAGRIDTPEDYPAPLAYYQAVRYDPSDLAVAGTTIASIYRRRWPEAGLDGSGTWGVPWSSVDVRGIYPSTVIDQLPVPDEDSPDADGWYKGIITTTVHRAKFEAGNPDDQHGFDAVTSPRAVFVKPNNNGANFVTLNAAPATIGVWSARDAAWLQREEDLSRIKISTGAAAGVAKVIASHPTVGNLDVVVKRERPINVYLVQVRLVDQKGIPVVDADKRRIMGRDPDVREVKAMLDSVYLPQVNVRIHVIHPTNWIADIPYGYANGGGLVFNEDESAWQKPFTTFLKELKIDTTDENQFFIFYLPWLIDAKSLSGTTWGYSVPADRFAVVGFPDINKLPALIEAHEIGHLLGLKHPWENGQPYALETIPDDSDRRLMGYGPSGIRLLRAEWDVVNNRNQ